MSSVYYPETNRTVENTNKIVNQLLHYYVD